MSTTIARWISIVGLIGFCVSFGTIIAGDHVPDRWAATTMMMVTYLFVCELRRT